MKRKAFAMVIALVMVFSAVVFAYASTDSGVSLYDTSDVTFVTDRTSRTSADVFITVGFTQKVDRYSVVIYLQKKVNGSWVLDTTNPDYVFYNNGWNSYYFSFSHSYTHLASDSTYRIKCVSKDYIDDATYITTTYSNSF